MRAGCPIRSFHRASGVAMALPALSRMRTIFNGPHPPGRLGTRCRQPADGRVLRDDPQPVAPVPGRGTGRQRVGHWRHRRHRRSLCDDLESLLRDIERLSRPSQGTGGLRLCARRLHQAGVCARAIRRPRLRGTIHRSHRQGNPRCAARRARSGHHAGQCPRSRIRIAAVAGYGWRVSGSAGCDRPDGVVGGGLPRSVLGRGNSRFPGRRRCSSWA